VYALFRRIFHNEGDFDFLTAVFMNI